MQKVFIILMASVFITSIALAETAAQKGLRIAKLVDRKNSGMLGEASKMEMIISNSHGDKVTRQMEGIIKEVPSDGDKCLISFQTPLDVKGTKMLTHGHKQEEDDQWLYLPSLRRVKRISSGSKSSSFMGSEFTYEDLGAQEIEKYKYTFLKEIKNKKHGGLWVLQKIPVKKSGYKKIITFISKKYYVPIQVKYFDRKGALLKVAVFSKFNKYKIGKKIFWRANSVHMSNKQTRKESTMNWKTRKLGVKYQDTIFAKSSLR
ncbi:MAG: outer membrane lipoprotein-sorting protein [Bacteriovoracaceae bacterium]|nr:outer membrane lipoprotein-sorting protein [Bacteriovoracaceae bacterium]